MHPLRHSHPRRSHPRPGRLRRVASHFAGRVPLTLGLVALLAVAGALVACATNPATGESQLALVSVQQEIEMGRQAHQEILRSMGAYPDDDLQAYVSNLGLELARASERPDLPWTFTVIDDPTVNAFALPGGYIYVTRGILAHMDSEAELVSVLGHEIGHVTARHGVERMSRAQLAQVGLLAGMIFSEDVRQYSGLAQLGVGLLFLQYSRDDERQADDLGFRYLNRADYEPREMQDMFRTLERVSEQAAGTSSGGSRLPVWLATHPNPGNRYERIGQYIASATPETLGTRVAREPFVSRLDGVVYGNNPREGFFRGETFHHPDLRFSLDFPRGWTTSNTRQAVTAVAPDESAVVGLTLAEASSAREAARSFFERQGIRAGQPWRQERSDALYRTFLVERQPQGENYAGMAAFLEHRGQVYRILGYTSESRYRRLRDDIASTLASFETLSDPDLLDVEPRRIDLVRVDRELTVEEFMDRYPTIVGPETLRILNGLEVGDRLQAGQFYKRVVGPAEN